MEGPDDPAGRVGHIIADKYVLLGVLGSGGMGAVFEAEHRFTGRRVALKLMHGSLTRSRSLVDRFVREARAPCSIGHPGIVDVLDGGRDADGALYLVLELLEGQTLGEALRTDSLDVAGLVNALVELLDALDAAHEAGFVHRDIKPDNVFLTRAGSTAAGAVKLLDFGVVGTLTSALGPELTQAGAIVGTPLYMSPEQALGHKADARSDLWSVGAIMYRALARRPPFVGDSYNAVIVSVATGEYTPLAAVRPDLPSALVAVVDRALRKRPEDRWQRAADMAQALEQALQDTAADGRAPLKRPSGDTTTPERPRPRLSPGAGPEMADTVAASEGAAADKGTEPEVTPPPMTAAAALESNAAVRKGGDAGRVSLTWIWIAGTALVASAGVVAAALLLRSPDRTGEPVARATVSIEPAATSREEAEPAGRGTAGTGATAGTEATQNEPVDETAAKAKGPEPEPEQPKPAAEEAPRGLSAEQLEGVVATHQQELKRCLQDATVRARSDEPSRLDVELVVDAGGRVGRVEVRGRGPEGLGPCVEQAVRKWRFPATDAESELSFPVLFEPKLVEL